jgi:hypothetical protein
VGAEAGGFEKVKSFSGSHIGGNRAGSLGIALDRLMVILSLIMIAIRTFRPAACKPA